MKTILIFLTILILFVSCSKEPMPNFPLDLNKTKACVMFDCLPKTYLVESSFDALPDFANEDFDEALRDFKNSCKSSKTRELYPELCLQITQNIPNSKNFITSHFLPYAVTAEDGNATGVLTGYYEPYLHGSLKKHGIYIYPVYATPKDLITVDLNTIYPDLKNYRLRGRIEGNKLVPYYTRAQSASMKIDADVLCYVDSKIDLFFLEVQGSGRVLLDTNETLFIGYDNQNGHHYSSIGRYLVDAGEIPLEDISLQSIRTWFLKHPKRVDEVLHHNKSVVYFRIKDKKATGSLGLELTPGRSIAVDKRIIPLGSMLYLNAKQKDISFSKIVQAQDTGGAIKGAIRADMFLGFGDKAREVAGRLKAPLHLWIFLPKDTKPKR